MTESKPTSGRRIVLVFGPLAILGGIIVIAVFSKYGRGNFTRAARIVEARGRAFELAAGIARCTSKSVDRALPPSSPWVPAEPPAAMNVTRESSTSVYGHEAFACAGFHPSGEVHIQVVWQRSDDFHGVVRTRLDDNGDGTADFEAESVVDCQPTSSAPAGQERCTPRPVSERRM